MSTTCTPPGAASSADANSESNNNALAAGGAEPRLAKGAPPSEASLTARPVVLEASTGGPRSWRDDAIERIRKALFDALAEDAGSTTEQPSSGSKGMPLARGPEEAERDGDAPQAWAEEAVERISAALMMTSLMPLPNDGCHQADRCASANKGGAL